MSAIELHMFRIKFIRPQQALLFEDSKTPAEIFFSAISEKPSAEFRKDYIWHVGNIEPVDQRGGSFAVGRTTKTTMPKYDNDTGNFLEEHFEESPYTFCIYDLQIGFVAIAKKSRLAPTTIGIATKLKKLLGATEAVMTNKVHVRIDPINDPESFIQKLADSYSIRRLVAHFTGPNPKDADEYFQKPISIYCGKINGESGKVIVDGASLDSETAVEVTKSTAATGNEVSAKIVESSGAKSHTIHLKGDPVKRSYAEERFSISTALTDMRRDYERVRD